MSIDIKILQSTCCGQVAPVREVIETAATKAGVSVTIEQPSDLQEIMKYGTMIFPSIVVNGRVYDYEQFGSVDDLAKLLAGEEVAGS
ncbi:MAG: thioredoxin family protein [Balneolaceae bacterium]